MDQLTWMKTPVISFALLCMGLLGCSKLEVSPKEPVEVPTTEGTKSPESEPIDAQASITREPNSPVNEAVEVPASQPPETPAGETLKTLTTVESEAPPSQPVETSSLPVPLTKPVSGKSYTIPDLKLDMLWCKPGTFRMGSPDGEKGREPDETLHEVTLTQGFWLGKYEVTQEQWEKVMGTNPSPFKGATLPVEQVSWKDAMMFCEKLTVQEKAAGRLPKGWVTKTGKRMGGKAYSLPTEAQWEYACRAGTTTAYSFGDTIPDKRANFNGNVGNVTPVGNYPATPWGFHDLHGNVWEWCLDWHAGYPVGPAQDPVGPSTGKERVIRGGGCQGSGVGMRSANRGRDAPHVRSSFVGGSVGFRLSLQTEKTE